MSFPISEKGPRVVRGTPQVSEGEGAQTLLPLLHISRFQTFSPEP